MRHFIVLITIFVVCSIQIIVAIAAYRFRQNQKQRLTRLDAQASALLE